MSGGGGKPGCFCHCLCLFFVFVSLSFSFSLSFFNFSWSKWVTVEGGWTRPSANPVVWSIELAINGRQWPDALPVSIRKALLFAWLGRKCPQVEIWAEINPKENLYSTPWLIPLSYFNWILNNNQTDASCFISESSKTLKIFFSTFRCFTVGFHVFLPITRD